MKIFFRIHELTFYKTKGCSDFNTVFSLDALTHFKLKGLTLMSITILRDF